MIDQFNFHKLNRRSDVYEILPSCFSQTKVEDKTAIKALVVSSVSSLHARDGIWEVWASVAMDSVAMRSWWNLDLTFEQSRRFPRSRLTRD